MLVYQLSMEVKAVFMILFYIGENSRFVHCEDISVAHFDVYKYTKYDLTSVTTPYVNTSNINKPTSHDIIQENDNIIKQKRFECPDMNISSEYHLSKCSNFIENLFNHIKKRQSSSITNLVKDDNGILKMNILYNKKQKNVEKLQDGIDNQSCYNVKENFINICGQCVSLHDIDKYKNIDLCGVCGGKNLCKACGDANGLFIDSCGQCLKLTDEQWNNCSKISSILPNVIDLAVVMTNVSFTLIGVGLDEMNIPNFECYIQPLEGNNTLAIKSIIMKRNEIIIVADIPLEEGEYLVSCKSSNKEAILNNQEINFVNSKSLYIAAVYPGSIKLGESVQIDLIVHGVITLADLICYIKDDSIVVAILPVKTNQGNSLASKVTCGAFTPKRATVYGIGIVYIYNAITKINTLDLKKITVKTEAPHLVNGGFTTDLRRIWIEFDKNVYGDSLCNSLVSENTYNLLGKDPLCNFVGNVLWVMLGNNASIKSSSEIYLLSDKIRSAFGDPINAPAILENVPLKINMDELKLAKPTYRLIGPNLICYSENNIQKPSNGVTSNLTSVIIIRTVGSEYLSYNVTISFDMDSRFRDSAQFQRNNLLTWFSVKQLHKSLQLQEIRNKINIYNSLLIPGVNYTFIITGQNQFNYFGESENITFRLANSKASAPRKPLQLLLSGPYKVYNYNDICIETKIMNCCECSDEPPDNLAFIWKLNDVNSITTDVSMFDGSKLHIPAGILVPNRKYIIDCELNINNENILSNSYEIETSPLVLEVRIGVTELTMGTVQGLELVASTNLFNAIDKKLQFFWSCEYNGGLCYVPESNATTLQDLYKDNFKSNVLRLKPGVLAVGRYKFEIKAKFDSDMDTYVAGSKSININIIPGDNPKINIMKNILKPVNPEEGIYIPVKISRIRPNCQMDWQTENENGFEYLNIHSMEEIQSNIVIPFDYKLQTKEFSLKIPGKLSKNDSLIFKEGASYKITLSVYCGGNSHSSVSIIVHTEVLPKPEELKVHPSNGFALTTKFYFTTDPAYAPFYDHPLTYNFGYQFFNDTSKIFVYSSSEWLETNLMIPCDSATQCTVITLLKVCNIRQICITKSGPLISLTSTKSVPFSSVGVIMEYSKLLSAQDYTEAVNTVVPLLKYLLLLPEKHAYNNASKQIMSVLLSRIIKFSKSVDVINPMIMFPAVSLLASATTILHNIPKSNAAISQLIILKNKILMSFDEYCNFYTDTASLNSGKPDIFSEKELNDNSFIFGHIRCKGRGSNSYDESMTFDLIKTMIKVSELAIMNSNDYNQVLNETQELIQNMETSTAYLCSCFSEENAFNFGTNIAILAVQKINLLLNNIDEVSLPDFSSNIDSEIRNLQVKFNIMQPDNYLVDSDFCLSSIVYSSDFLSKIHGIVNPDKKRWSYVYFVSLQNSEYVKLKNEEVQMILKIQLLKQINYDLRCHSWNDKKGWSPDFCLTIEFHKDYILCKCPVNHYISVFADKKTEIKEFQEGANIFSAESTDDSVNTILPDWEIVPLKSPKFIFRIEEDYQNTVVNKEKFEESIKVQLNKQLKIPFGMLLHVTVSPGSFIVTMHFGENDVTISKVLPKLVQLLKSGELLLFGLDEKKLNIPPQNLQITENQGATETGSHIGLLVICMAIVCFSVLFISIFVVSLIIKRNRDKITNSIIQNLETPGFPKYRHLYFEESIEGSEKSLSQYYHSSESHKQMSLSPHYLREEHDSGIGIITKPLKSQTV